jgi:hypothetical protein
MQMISFDALIEQQVEMPCVPPMDLEQQQNHQIELLDSDYEMTIPTSTPRGQRRRERERENDIDELEQEEEDHDEEDEDGDDDDGDWHTYNSYFMNLTDDPAVFQSEG